MISINNMIKRIAGLVNTKDVNEWEDGFIASIVARTDTGNRVDHLSEKQVEHIVKLYRKHFAG